MLVRIAIILLSALCLTSAQFDCFGEGEPRAPNFKAVAKGADNFAFKLFTDIAVKYPRNSIVLSPYSVWSVLNLAYYGAGGNTESQLQRALGVPSKSDAFYGGKIIEGRLRLNEGTVFDKADKAYFDETMKLRNCAIDKLTEIEKVNFKKGKEAADKINMDVSRATHGKINKFLSPSVLRNARFVLLNAVYFKGNWTYQFDPKNTKKRSFYNEDRSKDLGQIDTMNLQAKLRHSHSQSLRASILELPYENSEISMYIILPDVETTLNSVLSSLSSDALDQLTSELKLKTTFVYLPRFKMTTRIADELKAGLRNMGIEDLFSASRADLSNFVVDERPFVDQALHHSTIEVSEEGTVAAAVTGLIGTRSGASDLVTFVADRPFAFLIRDASQGMTLFMGVLRNPKQTIAF